MNVNSRKGNIRKKVFSEHQKISTSRWLRIRCIWNRSASTPIELILGKKFQLSSLHLLGLYYVKCFVKAIEARNIWEVMNECWDVLDFCAASDFYNNLEILRERFALKRSWGLLREMCALKKSWWLLRELALRVMGYVAEQVSKFWHVKPIIAKWYQ